MIQNVKTNHGNTSRDLRVFFIKLISVFASVFIFFAFALSYLKSEVENSALVKGGPEFWRGVEMSFYKLADSNDIPPEKKAKIIEALRKISAKYGPLLEALERPGKSS